jgi:hypothetical protein
VVETGFLTGAVAPDGFLGSSIRFSNVGYGPIKLQSRSPFQALRLGMIPLTSSTLSRGQKEVRGEAPVLVQASPTEDFRRMLNWPF